MCTDYEELYSLYILIQEGMCPRVSCVMHFTTRKRRRIKQIAFLVFTSSGSTMGHEQAKTRGVTYAVRGSGNTRQGHHPPGQTGDVRQDVSVTLLIIILTVKGYTLYRSELVSKLQLTPWLMRLFNSSPTAAHEPVSRAVP